MNSAPVSSTLIEALPATAALTASGRTLRAALHRCGPLVLLSLITSLLGWCFAHVFAGEPGGSDNSFHYGELVRLTAAIRAGDWNWWNPSGNSGFASGYYYQVLPQALPALLSAVTGLSPLVCFQLGIFVPLVLVPAVAYRAVRIAGGTSWQALGASLAVPFAVGSSHWGHGADGTFTVGLYTQLWALAAFPLALAHATRWLEERRGLAAALAWGLFVGLCHPFAGVALGLALFAGVVGGTVREAVATWWPGVQATPRNQVATAPRTVPLFAELPRLVVLGALLLLGAACAWLPVLVDYDGFGGFPQRAEDEIGAGFIALVRWLVEGQLLDEGRAVSLLTALLPLVLYLATAHWLPRLWAAGGLFALLLGLGPHLPKIGDDLLPPVRFIGPLQIVLALCVGIGVAAVVEQMWQKTEPRRNEEHEEKPEVRSQKSEVGNAKPRKQSLFSLRALCVLRSETPALNATTRFGTLVAAALVALLVVTSGAQILRGRVTVASDLPGIARDQLGVVMDAMQAAPGRAQAYGGAANHWAMMLPYVEAGRPASAVPGGAALQASPNFVYHRNLADPVRVAWVFDAPFVLARPGELHVGDMLKTTNAYELRVLPAPGLVSPVQVTGVLPPGRNAARAAGLRWLASELPLQNKVLAHHGSDATSLPPRGRTLSVTRGDSIIRAEVEAEATTTFIVRESWHPRWRATLDGVPVPIRHVTPYYMAIDVPEAKHQLELRFERPLWTWLLWLLWPGLSAAAWAFERRRKGARVV